MIHMETSAIKSRGFTLIETILYVGLFGIMFTGIFLSIYPFFTGAEKLSNSIATESEIAFILSKIQFAITDTVTSTQGQITIPAEGETSNTLSLSYNTNERYIFAEDATNAFCTPPLTCSMLTLAEGPHTPLPLNSERVDIKNFTVTHVAPTGNIPRSIEVSFDAHDVPVGPIRFYLHF